MSNNNNTPKVGERVYYTGDMANASGFGYCASIVEGRFGTNLEIVLEAVLSEQGPEYGLEERRFFVSPASFSPGPGRRFWRHAEYVQDRAEKVAAMTGETVEEVLRKMAEHAKAEKAG